MLDPSMALAHVDQAAFSRAQSAMAALAQNLPDDALATLAKEVVSRLTDRFATDASDEPDAAALDAFCDALLSSDEAAAPQIITDLHDRGASLDSLYLGYIAGAARRLGQRWDEDATTFYDMTIAAGRMYAIMRGLRGLIAPNPTNSRRHALFAAVPSEDHTLGITMAADMFRQRGWDIELDFSATHDALVEATKRFDHIIIGLSAGRPSLTFPLARLITALRICKPHAFIMVSGHITVLEPNIKRLVDADVIATDANSAIAQAELYIVRQQRPSEKTLSTSM